MFGIWIIGVKLKNLKSLKGSHQHVLISCYSEPFKVNPDDDHEWRLLIFPNGNRNNETGKNR